MTPTGKSQPQALLEEIIPKDLPRDENEKYPSDPEPVPGSLVTPEKWPSVAKQAQYWSDKEKAAEPKPPRKWSLARRRKFNATVAKKKEAGWIPVPPPQEEPVQMVRFCPCCGRNIERFLA